MTHLRCSPWKKPRNAPGRFYRSRRCLASPNTRNRSPVRNRRRRGRPINERNQLPVASKWIECANRFGGPRRGVGVEIGRHVWRTLLFSVERLLAARRVEHHVSRIAHNVHLIRVRHIRVGEKHSIRHRERSIKAEAFEFGANLVGLYEVLFSTRQMRNAAQLSV